MIGGDEEISYENMIKRIINFLYKKNKISFCKVVTIPNRIFLLIFTPLLLISPKIFDAIQRLGTNLSGFTKVNLIIKEEKEKFQ